MIDNWIKDNTPNKAVTNGSVIEEESGAQNRNVSLEKTREVIAGNQQQ